MMSKGLDITKRYTLLSLLMAISLALVFSLFTIEDSNAQFVCRVDQITDDQEDDSDQPQISGDGNLVTFRSEADFTGQNPDNNDEIFIYNVLLDEFTQATFSTGGNNSNPFLSPDGSLVVFHSGADLNGFPPNNGFDQIFIYDVAAGTNQQITNGSDGDSNGPVINGLNSQIAFRSLADLTSQNPLNEGQIFLYNIANGTFEQITNSTSGVTVFPSSDFNGDIITLESSANLTGQNPNNLRRIFKYNSNSGVLSQVTSNTDGESSQTNRALDDSGELLAFAASADPNGGGSNFPTGLRKLYLAEGNSPFLELTPEPLVNRASISYDGTCIAFTSEANITGENPLGQSQVFLYNILTEEFTQVTDIQPGTGGNPSDANPNNDCTRISFRRSINTDDGPSVQQILLATCIDPNAARPIPTISEWSMIAVAAFLGIAGLIAIRRKAAA